MVVTCSAPAAPPVRMAGEGCGALAGAGAGAGAAAGAARGGCYLARVELTDALGGLAKLLTLLGREIFELTYLDRETFEKIVDLVDLVAAQTDRKGDGVDGVEGGGGVIRAIHPATLPPPFVHGGTSRARSRR